MDVITPDDLRLAAAAVRASFDPHAQADWTVQAGDLEWSCLETLTHTASALVYYAVNLAMRTSGEPISGGRADPTIEPEFLLQALEGRAVVVASLASAASPEVRAAHPNGMADASGFVAMGCDEILVHAGDIARGLHIAFDPPGDLCARVLARLFPWAPIGSDAWATLRWANGRAPLGERPRLGPDWTWHCAPLEEWDGTDPTATA